MHIIKRPSNTHVRLSDYKNKVSVQLISRIEKLIPGAYSLSVDTLDSLLVNLTNKRELKIPDLTRSKLNADNTPVLIIDVRRSDRHAQYHIPTAVNIHTVMSRRMARHLKNVDIDTPIVVYSDTGLRAEWAAFQLRRVGFKSVKTLDGGFFTWQISGKPVRKALLEQCPSSI